MSLKKNMKPLRLSIPSRRTQLHSYRTISLYKADLRDDFNQHCGYCGDTDRYGGGHKSFHIDHFAPKIKFPELEFEYSNFIYSCPYCNRAKSDKWVTSDPLVSINNDSGFCDPCSSEYDRHLMRDSITGTIYALTSIGEYMYQELKLYLLRHKVIYQLEKLSFIIEKLRELSTNPVDEDFKVRLTDLYIKLHEKYWYYNEHLNDD